MWRINEWADIPAKFWI